MEGKKIAFIVVAIATVGGIGYFLYKKNKASAINTIFSTEEKGKASAKTSSTIKQIAKQEDKKNSSVYAAQKASYTSAKKSPDLYE